MENASEEILNYFSPEGILAQEFSGFEARKSQAELAQQIQNVFTEKGILLAEGPTGTGKTLAYLVAAILHAKKEKKNILVVTANIALQEQLINKDLPQITKLPGLNIPFTLAKGAQNYLCLSRLESAKSRFSNFSEDLLFWAENTQTGDKSDIDFKPKPFEWKQIEVDRLECTQDKCTFAKECKWLKKRNERQNAQLVVTNYHLLFTHLKLKHQFDIDTLLPQCDILIADEAHKLPDIARELFGYQFSLSQIKGALRELNYIAEALGDADLIAIKDSTHRLTQECDWILETIEYELNLGRASGGFKTWIKKPIEIELGDFYAGLTEVSQWFSEMGDFYGEPENVIFDRKSAWFAKILSHAKDYFEQKTKNHVYSISFKEWEGKKNLVFYADLISPDKSLNELVYEEFDSNIFMSATLTALPLTANDEFSYFKKELGLNINVDKNKQENITRVIKSLKLSSPFNLKEKLQVQIVPANFIAPNQYGFLNAFVQGLEVIIKRNKGRTLVLCTSHKTLNFIKEHLFIIGFDVYFQSDAPRSKLIKKFKENEQSVLIGTESFWAGIDIPGKSLTQVVIEKIPFPHPNNPLNKMITSTDPKWFMNSSLPKALILMKQGVGRLIRSNACYGKVTFFDSRLHTKFYGKKIIKNLFPQGVRVDNLQL